MKKKELQFRKEKNGCMVCISHKPKKDGYIRICLGNRNHYEYLHRIQYRKYNGEIPKGKIIRHTCDNRECGNPEHLILGTPKQNSMDMVKRGRSNRGSSRYNSKFNESDVRSIRSDKRTLKEIARDYNCTFGAIHCIKRRKTWGWVK